MAGAGRQSRPDVFSTVSLSSLKAITSNLQTLYDCIDVVKATVGIRYDR